MRPSGRISRARVLVLLLCAAPALLAAQADSAGTRAVAPPAVAWAKVTYISGQSAYIDAGSANGLKESAPLTVVRAGEPIAELVVEYISSTRASCRISSSTAQVAVGDSVRYTPVPSEVRAAAPAFQIAGAPAPHPPRSPTASWIRGRVGFRYLLFDPGVGGALSQPAVDLRLDGQHLGNGPIGLAVDVRAQRAISSSSALSATGANTTRVYQAALIWNPAGSPTRITVGRQFATTLSSVGLFDGAAFDFNYNRWSLGAFGGFEPDVTSLGLSGLTHEYGAYVQLHNARGASPIWTVSLGGVGAYAGDQIDREFGVLQATYNSRRLSVYAAQEADLNRGWKAAVEPSLVTPTSSFVTALFSLTDALHVNAGYDNRRSVLLYRDYVNPEITFDDTFREGEWGGASLYVLGHVRVSGDVRLSSGGPIGNSQSNTGALSFVRLTPLQLGVHFRTTVFNGTLANGRLQSVAIEITPFGIVRIEGSAGTRDSSVPLDSTSATRISWTGIDADFGIGRSVYVMVSTYRESGTNDRTLQSFVSLSYRF